jgi:hypothetical protein
VRKKKGKWTEKILYSFPTNKNGVNTEGGVYAGVVLDAEGNIYGGTLNSVQESVSYGIVYELVAPSGKGGYKAKSSRRFKSHGWIRGL